MTWPPSKAYVYPRLGPTCLRNTPTPLKQESNKPETEWIRWKMSRRAMRNPVNI